MDYVEKYEYYLSHSHKSLVLYKNRRCGMIVHETAAHQMTVEFKLLQVSSYPVFNQLLEGRTKLLKCTFIFTIEFSKQIYDYEILYNITWLKYRVHWNLKHCCIHGQKENIEKYLYTISRAIETSLLDKFTIRMKNRLYCCIFKFWFNIVK